MSSVIPKIGGSKAVGGGILGGIPGYFVGQQADADEAIKRLKNSLIQPIQTPRVLPTINADAVKKARNNSLLNLQSRSGRASTLLTSNTFGG